MSAVVVRFNDADEFLAELAERPPDVEHVVRLTRRFIPARSDQYGILPYAHVQVVASYLRRGLDADDPLRVVELATYCGQRWPGLTGTGPPNESTDAMAERIMALVQARAGQLGYAVAAGVYQPAEDAH